VVQTGAEGWMQAWVIGKGSGHPAHIWLPRLWVVAEVLSPRMDGPAGTRGAQHPTPPAPATPSWSPQYYPLQAALPNLHL
jgi:hypothetical protein